ncbi:MAG: GNAT family N-acetyltransferase [Candidatus Xenobia bacterium]
MKLELMRPGEQHIDLVSHLNFLTNSYPPFETEEEMKRHLRGHNRGFLENSLLILRRGNVIGHVRVGPFRGHSSLLQLGLVPPFDRTPHTVDILTWLLHEFKEPFPDLNHGIYEDKYRAAFEAVGFQTMFSMRFVKGPIEKRPVRGSNPYRKATKEDAEGLAELMSAAYEFSVEEGRELAGELFGTTVGAKTSYVGLHEDGSPGFPAASLITCRQGQKLATMAHSITHPSQQKKGWSTQLAQLSVNDLADEGCEHLVAWCLTSNESVLGLLRRFGMEPHGPQSHQGALSLQDRQVPAAAGL